MKRLILMLVAALALSAASSVQAITTAPAKGAHATAAKTLKAKHVGQQHARKSQTKSAKKLAKRHLAAKKHRAA